MTIFLQMLVQEPNKLNIEQGRFLGFHCHTNSAELDMQQNDTSPLVQGKKENYTKGQNIRPPLDILIGLLSLPPKIWLSPVSETVSLSRLHVLQEDLCLPIASYIKQNHILREEIKHFCARKKESVVQQYTTNQCSCNFFCSSFTNSSYGCTCKVSRSPNTQLRDLD